jgi:hypothetical protein
LSIARNELIPIYEYSFSVHQFLWNMMNEEEVEQPVTVEPDDTMEPVLMKEVSTYSNGDDLKKEHDDALK